MARIPTDFTATRQGNQTVFHLTPPKSTLDNEPLDHDSRVEICRSEGASECRPVVDAPLDRINNLQDKLPPALMAGPPVAVSYKARILNARGRAAGWTGPVTVAGGDAPEAVTGIQTRLRGEGLVLRWTSSSAPFDEVRLERTEPDKPRPKPGGTRLSLQGSEPQTALTVAVHGTDPGGAVDKTAEPGHRYVYRIERRRHVSLNGQQAVLAGAATEVDTGVLQDTTAPAAPQSLVGLATGAGIALSWLPGTEPDIAGYVVYRGEPGSEVRMNSAPVAAPQFTDTAVEKGRTYRYRVAAVDQAGNESQKSEPVSEEMR